MLNPFVTGYHRKIFRTLCRYSYIEVAWIRYSTHLLFMLVILVPRRKTALLQTCRPVLQVVRRLIMIGMPVFAVIGSRIIRSGDALTFMQISPLLVLLLSVIALHEPVRFNRWMATLTALIGALMIIRMDRVLPSLGVFLLLGSALCLSLYQILTRILRTKSWLTNLFYTTLVVFVPISFLQPNIWIVSTPINAILMITIGLVGLGALWALETGHMNSLRLQS